MSMSTFDAASDPLATGARGHEVAVGPDADTAEVEAVGVPRGADRRIVRRVAVRVAGAGVDEGRELRGDKVELPLGVEVARELRAARSMLGVDVVGKSHRVMERGEGVDEGHVAAAWRRVRVVFGDRFAAERRHAAGL
jgi:hypothetical protein